MPLVEVLSAMERVGIRRRRRAAGRDRRGDGRADRRPCRRRSSTSRATSSRSARRSSSPRSSSTSSGLTKKRRGKTGFSTDARVLAQIRDEHEIVAKVESWRELTKLKNTYLDALPELIRDDGRIHTTFNQVTAATGRLSSTESRTSRTSRSAPSWGGRFARASSPSPGWRLLSCDYNQVELRVLAHVAGEDVLREIFASGEDVHARRRPRCSASTRPRSGPAERSKAKMVNYGIAYGLSDFGLADRLQISREEAGAYITRYFERFPAVKRFIDETIERAETEGLVKTLMGRRRLVPELRSSNRQRRMLGERLAVNTVIQGTAADIIKVAMVRCQRALADVRRSRRG